MTRPFDKHLDPDELHALVLSAATGVPDCEPLPGQDLTGALRHVESCQNCSRTLQIHQSVQRGIAGLPVSQPAPQNPDCLGDAQWLEVATGLLPAAEAKELMKHAAQCARCGPLLKNAVAMLADEASPEEEVQLASISGRQPEWQNNVVRALPAAAYAASATSRDVPREPEAPRPRNFRPFSLVVWPRLAFVAAAVVVLAASGWLAYRALRPPSVDQLLAEAYTEQRTIELRLSGAGYAPTHVVRGPETTRLSRPSSLLEAEALIAKQLRSRPDDVKWLHAQGQADLLDNNYDSAVSVLERARRSSLEDPQLKLDLATAYFSQAEQSHTPADYGMAVQLLTEVLRNNPKNQVALFNRAIAQERIFAYHEAKSDWLAYLQLDSASEWAAEARARLADLEEKIRKQSERVETPLLQPAAFVRAFRGTTDDVASIDAHAEMYFELALEHWLPQLLVEDSITNTTSYRAALESLAQLLVARHKDPWLVDFLASLDGSSTANKGARSLTDALLAAKTTGLNRARVFARAAEKDFRETGNRAGIEMAMFEQIYANQLEHRSEPCFRGSGNLLDGGRLTFYPWLHVQVLLESAACDDLSDDQARRRAAEARELASKHRYPVVRLRATGFLAGLYEIMGDSPTAWKYYVDGLAQFWAGNYPPMRGYNLLAGLDIVAQENQWWFLDVQLIREAFQVLVPNTDLALAAVEQQRLAEALLASGDPKAAEENFRKAGDLFLQTAASARKENLQVETQIWLANVQLLMSAPQEAIRQLEGVRERVGHIPDKDLAFEFFGTSGLAYLAAGDKRRARLDLQRAVLLAEESLHLNQTERERLLWSRKTDSAYRGIVEVDLADDAKQTFARWEWYKGASLRGISAVDSHHEIKTFESEIQHMNLQDSPLPEGTALVSYAVFRGGTAVWVRDGLAVHERWINVPKTDLDSVARLFAEHCSHPDSNVEDLQYEGRRLYELLVHPVDDLLDRYRRVIIEPDGQLWQVPFQALEDSNGRYLGDRFALSFSSGLAYLANARAWKGVTPDSRALVVGDPYTDNWAPLPEAEEEAKGIATQFRHPHLLLNRDATVENLAAQIGSASVFHFSGHASASARGAGLVLQNSTFLGVGKFGPQAFHETQLVVLSACSTANGGTGVFDEQDSVARSVMTMGVPAIVASHWMVDSQATSSLMQQFYHHLLDGELVSEAIANAAKEIRAQRRYGHPFYWAGFSVFGKG